MNFIEENTLGHDISVERPVRSHPLHSPMMPSYTGSLTTMNTTDSKIDTTPYRENLLKLQSRLASNHSPFDTKRSIPVRVSSSFGASLALQQGERERELKRSLEIEYRDLFDRVNALNRDLTQLNYRKANLKHNISDINSALNSLRLRLDSVLQAAEKSIGHAKQMSETHLDEFLLTLEDLYAKLKFNLSEQVASARDFRDEGLDLKALSLEKELENLEEKASDLRRTRDNAIREELESLNLQLERHIRSKQQQCDALDAQLQESEAAYAKASSNHVVVAREVHILEEECAAVEQAVQSIESRLANHANTRHDLGSRLATATEESMAAQSENELAAHELNALSITHEEFQSKLKQYESYRQILENSIMDHEGLPRVYVRGDTKLYPEAIESCNKVFPAETCEEILADEYKHLIGGIARGRSVSVVYLGQDMDLNVQIVHCYNHTRKVCESNALITLQRFAIDGEILNDLFNKGKSVSPATFVDSLDKLPLQAMIIGNDGGTKVLAEALETYGKSNDTTSVRGYILQVTEKGLKGSALFLGLPGKGCLDFFEKLRGPGTVESLKSLAMGQGSNVLLKFASYALHQTQCLFLADLTMIEPHSTLQSLIRIRHCN